jgi:rhodanese-related sulfurtransferase
MFRSLFGGPSAAIAAVTAAELKRRLDAGERLYLLDVRSAEEYAHDGHIKGAHLVPLHTLGGRSGELPKDTRIVCICRSGARSSAAAEQLARQGFDVVNLTGGMMAWGQAGLPTKRG